MKAFVLLAVLGAALAAPSDLSGLEHHHHHHDEHQHHHDDAAPQLPAAELREQLPAYEEPEGPPQPYSFTYQAGRYPGHVDRTHSESRGENGVVVGTYEYLDPLQRVVKVDYTADDEGFHPNVQGAGVPRAPKESSAVAAARQRFFEDSARIVAEQIRIGREHAEIRAATEARDAAEQYV